MISWQQIGMFLIGQCMNAARAETYRELLRTTSQIEKDSLERPTGLWIQEVQGVTVPGAEILKVSQQKQHTP